MPKSATGFVDAGTSNVQELINSTATELERAEPDWMREYDQDGRIVRLTLLADGHIEKTVIEQLPSGCYLLVTTFDSVTIQDAKLRYGKRSGR